MDSQDQPIIRHSPCLKGTQQINGLEHGKVFSSIVCWSNKREKRRRASYVLVGHHITLKRAKSLTFTSVRSTFLSLRKFMNSRKFSLVGW